MTIPVRNTTLRRDFPADLARGPLADVQPQARRAATLPARGRVICAVPIKQPP